METSRTVRIHLVYQFIILTSLVLCIGYYEFLLDKKFLLILGLVTVLFYQWMTLSCYTELLLIVQRKGLREILFGTSNLTIKDENKEPSGTRIAESQEAKEPTPKFHETNMKSILTESTRTSNKENCAPKPRIYKLRNSQTNGFNTINNSSSAFNSNDENRLKDSELTKVYFFPHRQKRLEQWIDSNGNARPYKISRVPNIEESEEFSSRTTSNNPEIETTRDPVKAPNVEETKVRKSCTLPLRHQRKESREEPVKNTEVSTTSSNMPYKISNLSSEKGLKMDTRLISNTSPTKTDCESVEDPTVNESRIKKSYTFPFRQKRIEEWEEPVEVEAEVMNTPSMPYWQNVDYSAAAKQKSRRRRSASISNLKNQQWDSMNNDNHREFSQSLEISDTSFSLHSDLKRSSLKSPNANFSKMKLMILNCFSKMKKDNTKTNSVRKEDADSKTRLFETRFQSRENLQSLEYEDRISLKLGDKTQEHSNSYIGFPLEKCGLGSSLLKTASYSERARTYKNKTVVS